MTQHQRIIQYCKEHDGITMMDGFVSGVNCTKINTRIGEIEKKGYVFSRDKEYSGDTWYYRYRLISEPLTLTQVPCGKQTQMVMA